MKHIEQNIITSFRLVKNDMIKMQNDMIRLSAAQERLMDIIDDLRKQQAKLSERLFDAAQDKSQEDLLTPVLKTIAENTKTEYAAKNGGKKFHIENCPFAKNILPRNKVTFDSEEKALNEGYKPCACVQ